MQELLINHFIKNKEDIHNESVRLAYGLLTSITGIVLNIALFVLKLVVGLKSGSISIASDAFNNLSDCLSCIVMLLGYKLASKPADRQHPFGHGRYEYIVSFIVTILIFIVGHELMTSSIHRIKQIEPVQYSIVMLVLLVVTMLVKIWMARFNLKIGKRIDNLAMIASAKDSRNDVFTTLIAVLTMVLSTKYPRIPFDGIGGLIVSFVIFVSGYGIAKEIIDKLLGSPASYELTEMIKESILEDENIQGIHDLIIHDYGPGVKIGSAHVEVDADMEFRKAHEIVDLAERRIEKETHVLMTLHLDPIELNNPVLDEYENRVKDVLTSLDETLSLHDFRMVKGEQHINLVFDVLIPFSSYFTKEEIQDKIEEEFKKDKEEVYCIITFDRAYVEK